MTRPTVLALLIAATSPAAHGQVAFEFSKSAAFLELEASDPVTAAGMYSAALAAGDILSGFIATPVTLKYTLDYAPDTLPPSALAAAFSTYTTKHAYPTVKSALLATGASPVDAVAHSHLPGGPFVGFRRNDVYDFTPPGGEIFVDDDGSTNNSLFDLSFSNAKALGLIGPHVGGDGADGTIKINSAPFDFDHTDGITDGTFDFTGVMLHELVHAMGFVSGADTMVTMFPVFGMPSPIDPDTVAMLTMMDLFRYSFVSSSMGLRDLSLPIPGTTGPDMLRFFSLDGSTPMEFHSLGVYSGFGDGFGAGHWAMDGEFGLMDPSLAMEFALTDEWLALFKMGLPMDMVALDAIGWTLIPSPGTAAVLPLAMLVGMRRRRA